MRKPGLLLAALLLAVTGSAGAAPLSVDDVLSITVDSTWGGLAKAQHYHGTFSRRAGSFVRDDGQRIDDGAIAALLDALNAPRKGPVTAAEAGITNETLSANLSEAESVLGNLRYPNVRAAYERRYFDLNAVQAWIDSDFSSFHTDDYPYFDVAISTTGGTIDVSSDSQHFMMLPFVVTKGTRKEKLYDVRFPRAVAALMPRDAANRARLIASLLPGWSSAVLMDSAVRDAINTIGRGDVARLAENYGLRLVSYGLMGGADDWVAGVAYAADPRITAEIQSPVGDPATQFATAQRRMRRISNVPWLKRALASNPDGRIHILPGGGIFSWEPRDFASYYKRPNAGAYLVRHQSEAVRLWIHEGAQHEYSEWYIFDDGTMILTDFNSGMNGFPFGAKGFDAIPRLPSRYGSARSFAGLLVHPDGSIETANP